ncbi:arginine-tRNA ligase [Phialophora macrospora]|uniref:arginine--tRNA ligase n=1 Tax=Phialophora macrospora TaxID=1851006 RepID=A0A0D2DMI8_9EURO|nr:arginine-tRNA ligase [Phialophora macrospora]
MATTSSEGLQGFLDSIGISSQSLAVISTDIDSDPLAICFSHLAGLVAQVTQCEFNVAYRSIAWASDMSHLMVIIPRLRLKGFQPQELAADLQQRWLSSPLFGYPVNDGINLLFYFANSTLARLAIRYILDRGSLYGKYLPGTDSTTDTSETKKQKVVVEFSSPNLGKAFDGLHLRSTIIGAFVASIYENMGWDVYRINFLGDWGKPVGLLAAGWSKFGSEDDLEADPLKHLLDVYTQTERLLKEQQEVVNMSSEGQGDGGVPLVAEMEAERDQYCKKLEDGDPDILDLWNRFRELCVTKYAELYGRLGIRFDEYSGESQVTKEVIEEVENTLKEKGYYHETHEGWAIEFSKPEEKGLGTVKARSSDGTTTYLLRDIAAALERSRKYSFDKMFYIVSARQSKHFQQVFKALELMDRSDLASKLDHFSFGDVHGVSAKEGASGSTLGDILDQCRDATSLALETEQDASGHFFGHDIANVADALGVMNLMVDELSSKRVSTVDFDPNKMATGSDYTGLSLQKWYTILSTRLRGVTIDPVELETTDYSLFEGVDNPYADMLRLLIQFPSIVRTWACAKLDPSHVLTFLFTVLDQMPSIWEEENEAEGSSAQSLAKLALYECLQQTLENGMRLLGLVPLVT